MILASSLKKEVLYLDNAAAFAPETEVLEYYFQHLKNLVPNQEAAHQAAFLLREEIDKAASNVASIVVGKKNANNYQVVFGNSATELFNLFFKYQEFAKLNMGASKLLHPALFNVLKDNCPKVEFLAVNKLGKVNLTSMKAKTFDALVLPHVQNEIGSIENLDLVRETFPNCLLVTDSVQAAGKIPFYQNSDVIFISGSKFGSPGGAALIFNKNKAVLKNFSSYVNSQRHEHYTVGRVNPAIILTFAYALTLADSAREDRLDKVSKINLFAREKASQLNLPTTLTFNESSPYILHFTIPGKQSAIVVRYLSKYDILAASGSACASESKEPSFSLKSMGFSNNDAFSGFRLSFSWHTTKEDVEKFFNILEEILKKY
jgi:cysteine desulfurase